MGVNLLVGLVERDLAVDRLPGLLVGLVRDVEKLAQVANSVGAGPTPVRKTWVIARVMAT